MTKGIKIRPLLLLLLLSLAPKALMAGPAWTYPIAATILEDRTGLLVLTNRSTLMDGSFVPPHLTGITKLRCTSRGMEMRKDALEALERMFAAAEKEGLTLYVKSAYRSYGTQNTMYQNRVDKYKKDDGVVAFPGSSDHQTGLAADVLNYEWTQKDGMRPEFGQTNEAKWMETNCASFGFILRYLPEKQDITGIIYEPWHFRYVGEEVAAYMMEHRLTLEEFTLEYQKAIEEFEQQGGDFKAFCQEQRQMPSPVAVDVQDEEGDSEVSISIQTP